MRDFAIVFKTLFLNSNLRSVKANGKRKISQKVMIIIVLIPFLLILCGAVGYMSYAALDSVASLSAIITAVVGIAQIVSLIFGFYGVINTLYSGSDRALLNSLPLRPASVFMAKFALSYLNLLGTCALLILPLGLTSSIAYAASGREMFYAFFALIFVVTLLAPILPLAVITLFSLPINYIGSFLKGRTVLKSVLSILVYVVIFAAYFAAIVLLNRPGGTSDDPAAVAGLVSSLSSFGAAFYPSQVMVQCALGINGWVNFGISAGITVGLILVTVLLAALFYGRISKRNLEAGDDKTRHAVSYKQSGIISALMKRDMLGIMRNPQLAMTNLATLILSPVITCIFYFATVQSIVKATEGGFGGIMGMTFVYMITSIYLGAANMLASLAFSRDGKAFYLNKALPIDSKRLVASKLLLPLFASLAANVVNTIIVLTLYKAHVANALAYLICSQMYIVGGIGVNIYLDARYGNVNWTNRQELKQVTGGLNRTVASVILTMVPFLGSIAGIVLGVLGMSLHLSLTVAYVIFWAACAVPSAAVMGVGLYLALGRAASYLDDFGERTFVQRRKLNSGGFMPPGRGGLLK